MWRHYYQNTDAVIFVVDSADRQRLKSSGNNDDYSYSASEELQKALQDENLKQAVVLFYANKRDLPNAMSTEEIVECLNMRQYRSNPWYVQAACATKGEGLYEGLDWLCNELNKR